MGGIKKLVKEATWEKLVKEATLVISASNNMLCDHNLLRSIIKRLTMKEIFKMAMLKNMDLDLDPAQQMTLCGFFFYQVEVAGLIG